MRNIFGRLFKKKSVKSVACLALLAGTVMGASYACFNLTSGSSIGENYTKTPHVRKSVNADQLATAGYAITSNGFTISNSSTQHYSTWYYWNGSSQSVAYSGTKSYDILTFNGKTVLFYSLSGKGSESNHVCTTSTNPSNTSLDVGAWGTSDSTGSNAFKISIYSPGLSDLQLNSNNVIYYTLNGTNYYLTSNGFSTDSGSGVSALTKLPASYSTMTTDSKTYTGSSFTFYPNSLSTAASRAYFDFTNNVNTVAGSYTGVVSLKAGYAWSDGTTTFKTFSYSINRASISPGITGVSSSYTYGNTISPSVSGNPGSGTVTWKIMKSGGSYVSFSSSTKYDAGSYTLQATVGETTNYLGNTCTKTFTIN